MTTLATIHYKLKLPWHELWRPTATAILVAGDALVENNQFDCIVGPQTRDQNRQNTVVTGLTTRVTCNLFNGPFLPAGGSSVLSAFTLGLALNTTTGNQATHCIISFEGQHRVNQGNRSILCPVQEVEPEKPQAPKIEVPSVVGVMNWVRKSNGDHYPVGLVQIRSLISSFETLADENGNFEFEVPYNEELLFTFTFEISLNSSSKTIEFKYSIDADENHSGNTDSEKIRRDRVVLGEPGEFQGSLKFPLFS